MTEDVVVESPLKYGLVSSYSCAVKMFQMFFQRASKEAGAKYPVHIVNYDYERYIEEVKDLFQENK